MWNIEYKGKMKGDIEKISSGKPLPEGSCIQTYIPHNISNAFVFFINDGMCCRGLLECV